MEDHKMAHYIEVLLFFVILKLHAKPLICETMLGKISKIFTERLVTEFLAKDQTITNKQHMQTKHVLIEI